MEGVRADAKSMINFLMAQICGVQDDDLLTVRFNITVQALGSKSRWRYAGGIVISKTFLNFKAKFMRPCLDAFLPQSGWSTTW